MIKEHFLKEINIQNVVRLNSKGFEVQKVQEWINLWRSVDLSWKHIVSVDGDFGPQTNEIIKIFQQKHNLKLTYSLFKILIEIQTYITIC